VVLRTRISWGSWPPLGLKARAKLNFGNKKTLTLTLTLHPRPAEEPVGPWKDSNRCDLEAFCSKRCRVDDRLVASGTNSLTLTSVIHRIQSSDLAVVITGTFLSKLPLTRSRTVRGLATTSVPT
jgi:hypothetical protein